MALLAACSTVGGSPQGTPTPSPALTPYLTPTAGGAAIATQAIDLESVERPTPTPYLYQIKANDTLFVLAARFGISVDAILVANPGLDPRLLSPGTEIIVPVGEEGEAIDVVPTPTPVPVELQPPSCFTNVAGQLSCFLLITNDQEEALENISAMVQYFSNDGELIASAEAMAPLNLLHPGNSMPLTATLADPPTNWTTAQGQLLTAFVATGTEERYLPIELVEPDIDIAASGLQAVARGKLTGGQGTDLVWVLAVAYGEDGQVVGFRRWESAGDEDEFEFWVYSLGPEIARVELLVEARP